MIEVRNLTKRFDGKVAVDDVSFSVFKGEVMGFLGPNGAGKTTTMRILTGYIPPTVGTALVGGYDVTQNPMAVKRLTGYLPEQVPLYPELRVREYLKFRAQLKGVGRRQVSKAVDEVIEECGLKEVEREIISHLSKGYRQRTGLADTLIAQPQILILDEPTIGLDPSQIRQTRQLIRRLGENRTLILSTHILSEVEAVCKRVLIIHRGRIVGEGTPAQLRERLRGKSVVAVELKGKDVDVEKFRSIPSVQQIEVSHNKENPQIMKMMISTSNKDLSFEEELFCVCSQNGWVLRQLYRQAPSLEDIFVSLVSDVSEDEKVSVMERSSEGEK